ncbi:MAG: class C sortase [Actinomycetaceae bacterium]|nr:class C sortase [Actinomycetaceae bacterium]MDY6082731.1 class C sortase [Actinomycetaceae bacterium]
MAKHALVIEPTPTSGAPADNSAPMTTAAALRKLALPIVLALVAVGIMLYPVVVTQLKNMEQIRVSANYTKQQSEAAPAELRKALDEARKYNASRNTTGPILDPWLARVSTDNADYQYYLSQLSTYDVMARIVIPSINLDLPVYHGTSDESLQRGVGHLYGTDLPVGGESTHSVLSAHTGLRNATLFDNLVKVKVGDAIYIGVSGERLKYQVYATEVVLPDQTDSLRVQPGKDLLTLVTCTPYGINTHRLLVHAKRVPLDAAESAAIDDPLTLNWQVWMFALMAASVIIIAIITLWARKQVKAMTAPATTASAVPAPAEPAHDSNSSENESSL